MNDYIINILIGYAKAGIIAWVLWFVYATVYIALNFKGNRSLHGAPKFKRKESMLHAMAVLILWPWGLFQRANNVVWHINQQLNRKEKN